MHNVQIHFDSTVETAQKYVRQRPQSRAYPSFCQRREADHKFCWNNLQLYKEKIPVKTLSAQTCFLLQKGQKERKKRWGGGARRRKEREASSGVTAVVFHFSLAQNCHGKIKEKLMKENSFGLLINSKTVYY